MAREFCFAGFRISKQEWDELDERFRLQYLKAFVETSPPRADEWAYEAYELSFDLAA